MCCLALDGLDRLGKRAEQKAREHPSGAEALVSFAGFMYGLNRLRKNTGVRVEFVESMPQGLKPVLI
jgi:hypothetical protein